MRFYYLRVLVVIWGGVVGGHSLEAAEPNPEAARADSQQANILALAALQAEADGDFVKRQTLLASAAVCSDSQSSLNWQQGMIKQSDGSWLAIEDVIARLQTDGTLKEYEQRRSRLRNDMESHLAIARWCAQHGLLPQARSHLESVLLSDPDHVGARAALGYQLVEGEWVSPQEIAVVEARGERARQSLAKFGSQLRKIARDLMHSTPQSREDGETALRQLQDAEAVLAVESLFNTPDERIANLIVEWLDQFDTLDATHALLRFAAMHPSAAVRDAATRELKERPLFDFVPELLSMLTSQISTMSVPRFNPDGTLAGYSQAFARQKQDQQEIFVINTQVQRQSVIIADEDSEEQEGNGVYVLTEDPANRRVERGMVAFANAEATVRNVITSQRNQAIAVSNARIASLLSAFTDQEFSGNPQEMWNWWDEYNATEYQQFKPSRYRQQSLQHVIPRYLQARFEPYRDPISNPSSRAPTNQRVQQPPLRNWSGPRAECFAAGTTVLTTRGLKPIESIVAGDTVFTRDIESGALVIKPVLEATWRPPTETVIVEVENDTFHCTPGHLFWVSGAAWKQAQELKPGDVLHSTREPALVSRVTKAGSQRTHNLRVADTQTFFVGDSQVLSHDVTPRVATQHIVPGLRSK